MTTNQIYDLFGDLSDGEEFNSEDAALRVMQAGYDDLLSQRDWYFLDKSVELSLDDLDLPDDFDNVLRVWYKDTSGNVSERPLIKTSFANRYDQTADYYVDDVLKKIVLINDITIGSLIVDYKHKPAALTLDDSCEPVFSSTFHPLLAVYMKKQFKSADENYDFYKETGIDFADLEQRMIDDDAKRKIQ